MVDPFMKTICVRSVMRSFLLAMSCVSLCVASACIVANGADLTPLASQVDAFVAQHCLDCHNSADSVAGLDLESFDFSSATFGKDEFDHRTWEAVLRRTASRQMPPPDGERPSELEYQDATQSMAKLLKQRHQDFPNPGRTESLRRLTRTEYQNVIRDLLSLPIDASTMLPPDESSHGFDNITVGELSPMLMSRYLSAAQSIARSAVGRTDSGPIGTTIRVPADRTQSSHVEGLPLGTRGGTAFDYHFSASGSYEIELRLTRDRDEMVEGLTEPHHIDVLLDDERIHQFAVKPPPGRKDFTHVDSHLRTRIDVVGGTHRVGVTFPSKGTSLAQTKRQPFDASYNRHRHPRSEPALFQVSIVGPLEALPSEGMSDSQARIFQCRPAANATESERFACARQIIGSIARLAYRRPVTDEDLSSPMHFYVEGEREGGFDAGIELALTSVLINPNFLFRIESDPDNAISGEAYRITDVELASRISFFLWSSSPDEELLALAETNQLHEPATLSEQVRRMLMDDRSVSLTTNFAAQWLYLRNLDSITPDLRLFPDFDDNLRQAFRGETESLFRDIVASDRSVMDLIATESAFLNERLAKHYGISGVLGSHFRNVDLPADSIRGGLLRHGSILTVTSYATRTSPTIRGHWILKNILGTAPPPPPANVPNLKEKSTLAATSVRDRLAQHRADPACASCHDLMDPVGFSLENFDAVGRWRDFDGELPIDSAGTLPDGATIGGIDELEAGILARPDMFVTTMTEKLLTFALGRGIEPEIGPTVRAIVGEAAESDYRFSSLISAIVSSDVFTHRSAP
ncbi:Planctomycete cytochrome C [Rubripirellula tenax]|uniref:Planctomycete cytochrome C n=1 Tax=Rubripirellula tenax TaxID=2528015 RepID=A0A5C6EIK7_9BACT|nr:DUF1592 domain-containing protein [Rubripirellula tenax]TWU48892.1 Planctomycete cytochrome C [Rubripirellula tenax]